MLFWRRILAGIILLLSAAGLLLSLAGGVGVWIVEGPVTARATRVFERIEAAFDIADQGLAHVETSLARAAERLDSAREDQTNLSREPRRGETVRRFLARTVQQRVAPEIDNAHEKLHAVAEAAVVVNSVLEDLGNLPFLSVGGLDLDRLAEINSRLADVGPAAWELSRLFGESEPGSDAAGAQLSQIERSLHAMRGLVAQYESQVTLARHRVEELKSRTLPWIKPAAIVISFVCFWIALSQLSLLFHGRSWWRIGASSSP
ncbi:MAG TPA: hypothetical protein VKE94_18225 [Gemmataceae bacterium]|nr:hypothetical protein [Gemmataceae bacterium]